ncbi:hypothetical protein IRJ41_000489 [Triplophysa rosa]|uniref:RNase H type-1 domain-containing protein n=1 Tax=Triplophysa rosa TaxID=992332 RepID=A0A9W7TCZ1_TRIRA|nr:hypothetical protein IRJ41_000489 [Triplophysa rosa]
MILSLRSQAAAAGEFFSLRAQTTVQKICLNCKKEQPLKQRLKKKLQRFDEKREEWVVVHKKNHNIASIKDEAIVMNLQLTIQTVRDAHLTANSDTSGTLLPMGEYLDQNQKVLTDGMARQSETGKDQENPRPATTTHEVSQPLVAYRYLLTSESGRAKCPLCSTVHVPDQQGTGVVEGHHWLCGYRVYLSLPEGWTGLCALVQLHGSAIILPHRSMENQQRIRRDLINFMRESPVPKNHHIWTIAEKLVAAFLPALGMESLMEEVEITRYELSSFINTTEIMMEGIREELMPLEQQGTSCDDGCLPAGMGCRVQRARSVRRWTSPRLHWHINCLELLAGLLALKRLQPLMQGEHILVRSDSTTAVAYIKRQGGIRSRQLTQLAQRLLWSQQVISSLQATHIPGDLNQTADALSRQSTPRGEWRLHPRAVRLIWEQFGQAQEDLLPPRTPHCPLWYSATEGPLSTDTLAHSWPRGKRKYAFPPVSQLITLHLTPCDPLDNTSNQVEVRTTQVEETRNMQVEQISTTVKQMSTTVEQMNTTVELVEQISTTVGLVEQMSATVE